MLLLYSIIMFHEKFGGVVIIQTLMEKQHTDRQVQSKEVARLLGLRGVPLRPHSSEGVG